jgi:calcium/calmodulin-dependent protein kinase I
MYAVKIIHRAELKPRDDEAVLNEVALMQSLMGDKYVVQVLDFYEEEDYFYIVMEYYAGGDVFDRIVKLVHYTEYDARALAIVLLKAVGSIHENGIAHRDIKPQVCLICGCFLSRRFYIHGHWSANVRCLTVRRFFLLLE